MKKLTQEEIDNGVRNCWFSPSVKRTTNIINMYLINDVLLEVTNVTYTADKSQIEDSIYLGKGIWKETTSK